MVRFVRNTLKNILRRVVYRYAPPDVLTALQYLRSKGGVAFPKRNIFTTDVVEGQSVLVLAPHPDDEIIGMGGTLAMHVEDNAEVTVLYLTDGGGLGDQRDSMIDIRRKEAEAVGRALGIRQIFWDREDTRLTNDDQTIADMVNVLKKTRPSVIYLPSYFDTHYDHFMTNQVLADALKKITSTHITVVGYEVWDNIPFPNYLVNISKYFSKKKELLGFYKTPLNVTDFTKLVANRGNVHYMLYIDSRKEKTPQGYAEAFCRFDAETYQSTFIGYVAVLERERSPMLAHYG